MSRILALSTLVALAGCGSLPGAPPPGTPPVSTARGSASMPQPPNSLPPGAAVNAGIDNSRLGSVTTRVQ